jgi:hypothetical protein
MSMSKCSLSVIASLVAMQLVFVADTVLAGIGEPPLQVASPATLVLLSSGAAVVAIGSWWRNRK